MPLRWKNGKRKELKKTVNEIYKSRLSELIKAMILS